MLIYGGYSIFRDTGDVLGGLVKCHKFPQWGLASRQRILEHFLPNGACFSHVVIIVYLVMGGGHALCKFQMGGHGRIGPPWIRPWGLYLNNHLALSTLSEG